MARTYAAIKERINEADVTLINDTVKVLFPRNVMFDFDQAKVRPDFFPVLSRFAAVLAEHHRTGILILGHTDNVGQDQHNFELSTRRADSARAVLHGFGVSANRLNSWGLGTRMPVASNETSEGRSLNRRVEFIVLYNYRNTSPATDQH